MEIHPLSAAEVFPKTPPSLLALSVFSARIFFVEVSFFLLKIELPGFPLLVRSS